MNAVINRLFAFLRAHACVLYAGIGMGIYRCAHEWPVWFGETYLPLTFLFSAGNLFLIVDIGKVLGVVLYVTVCYLRDQSGRSGALLAAPCIVLVAGYAMTAPYMLGANPGTPYAFACLVICGFGAGMLFSQWIEVCGRLSPLCAIEALSVSYLVRFALLPIITGCTGHLSLAAITVLAGSSFIQIAWCRQHPKGPLPEAGTYPRQLPNRRAHAGYSILLVWTGVYAFTFGLGEGSTQLAHHVTVSGIGYVVPSLLVAVLAFRLGDRFDRSFLYAVSIPLMAAGLICLEFFGLNAAFAQVLVSAGMCAFELLVYTMACIYAYRSRTSAMFAGSCVRVIALVAADMAVLLVHLIPASGTGMLVVAATIATVGMGFIMFHPQVNERLEQRHLAEGNTDGDDSAEPLRAAAARAGLSPRETTVFLLLAEGKTSTQISDELFISNGAVRSHCSRIYDKFGVHSRKDFDALMASGR